MSASISTPVLAVARQVDWMVSVVLSACVFQAKLISVCSRGIGWQRGMSLSVCLAACMAAICAVVRALPFVGCPARRVFAVVVDMEICVSAVASRAVGVLAPTLTICARPDLLRCVAVFFVIVIINLPLCLS